METPYPEPERIFPGIDEISPETFPAFLDEIGLVGMGGSGFPAAEKIRSGIGAHTLVINGVECEPGITIDQSVLLHESLWVAAGANASAKAIGAKRIILAVKKDDAFIAELQKHYGEFDIISFPDRYPAGAEKLILTQLIGKTPPPGVRPYQMGHLVQNVASLRAIGRAIIDGIPVVERPLTLSMPSTGFYKNIIAPVGLSIREVLETVDLPFDLQTQFIVDSGLMMGSEVGLDDCIEKTTLSLIILERKKAERKERPCIRCGACNNACPLGLHPFTLVDRIQKGKTKSAAFKMQMTECFLCGVCSAVCPSDIPLVQSLAEGKRCL
ncbi:Electron transport complex subunit RnfC [Pontiella sulfatireligans]|uniref:Electron transport complex subunit RnfC n=2 Tax=Pontiella sulfatireligans TaxID=2750658 RepID=A0A6C2UH71_9BACT|nr:Electron transport complex subunit RnfC [Pontiella sulfatireligans]